MVDGLAYRVGPASKIRSTLPSSSSAICAADQFTPPADDEAAGIQQLGAAADLRLVVADREDVHDGNGHKRLKPTRSTLDSYMRRPDAGCQAGEFLTTSPLGLIPQLGEGRGEGGSIR